MPLPADSGLEGEVRSGCNVLECEVRIVRVKIAAENLVHELSLCSCLEQFRNRWECQQKTETEQYKSNDIDASESNGPRSPAPFKYDPHSEPEKNGCCCYAR